MAKNWYPMIDFEKCTQCGACVDMCQNGVYDKEKAPKPVVVNPDGCIDGCKGCGDRCPENAIQYMGDQTDDCNCEADSCGGESGCC